VAVKLDRGVDILHDRVGLGAEASTPHLVAHDTPLMKLLPKVDW
jgi:hypothetical protein